MEDHKHHSHLFHSRSTCTTPAPPSQPSAQPAQPGPVPQLNWSHFKLEVSSKPDEDAEAHLLRKNNWMDTHAFPEGVKVQRFCLMLYTFLSV